MGEIFRTRPDWPWSSYSFLYNGYRVSLPGVKRPGRGVNYAPPSNAEVEETTELYSLAGPSWPVLGQHFLFTFIFYTLLRGIIQKKKEIPVYPI